MHTEEEAKKKWCPMVRHTMDAEGNFHTTNNYRAEGFQPCIASECMMWKSINNCTECASGNQGYCGLTK